MKPDLQLGGKGTSGSTQLFPACEVFKKHKWLQHWHRVPSSLMLKIKTAWTPPASRMFLFRGLCKTDGENKKGKWKQEDTSVSSRAGWRVLCLSEEILVPMDCTSLAAEFLVFAVDAITCSSRCYHRNHKICLKVYNTVTWLWFWKLNPFNFVWFILFTLLWRFFHQ